MSLWGIFVPVSARTACCRNLISKPETQKLAWNVSVLKCIAAFFVQWDESNPKVIGSAMERQQLWLINMNLLLSPDVCTERLESDHHQYCKYLRTNFSNNAVRDEPIALYWQCASPLSLHLVYTYASYLHPGQWCECGTKSLPGLLLWCIWVFHLSITSIKIDMVSELTYLTKSFKWPTILCRFHFLPLFQVFLWSC